MFRKKFVCRITITVIFALILIGCAKTEVLQETGIKSEETRDGAESETREEAALKEDIDLSEPGTQDVAEMTEEDELPETDTVIELKPTVKEIPVEFPFDELSFDYGEVDEYSLILAQLEEPAGEYELRLYNENEKIIQQISLGTLTEPIQISMGDFSWDPEWMLVKDIEIFPADGSSGLYIRWDGLRFSENVIEIPRYDEVRDDKMLTIEDGEIYQVRRIYELGGVEIRRWQLNKKTGELEIWDCMDGESLFKGVAKLDEEGNPVNKEYYDMLLWEETYYGKEKYSKWTYFGHEIGENGEPKVKYESREDLLTDLGLEDSEPIYQYYDWHHNLLLELYMNKTMKQGCAIGYEYYYDHEKREKWAEVYGYSINGLAETEEWTKDPYSDIFMLDPDELDFVEGYKEIMEYTPDGKPDYYRAQGMVAFNTTDGLLLTKLMELEYVYRDDGTLFYRYFFPMISLWSSMGSTYSYYDEKGRIAYEIEYNGYEPLRHFYIYNDKGNVPAYHLYLDYWNEKASLYPVRKH